MTTIDILKRLCDAFFLVAQFDQYGADTCTFMSLVECELYGNEYDTDDTDGFTLRAFDLVKPFIKALKAEELKEGR